MDEITKLVHGEKVSTQTSGHASSERRSTEQMFEALTGIVQETPVNSALLMKKKAFLKSLYKAAS